MGRGFRSEIVVGLIVLVLFVLGAIFFSDVPPVSEVQSLRTWQEADAPPGYPLGVSEDNPEGEVPDFPGDFVMLDAFERFAVPPAARFEWPHGTESGALTRIVQPFLAEAADGSGRHLGIDLDEIGDAGFETPRPVYAAGNGVVLHAAESDETPGRVIILGHRRPDGSLVQSLYGRLHSIDVARGALVARGQQIGTAEGPLQLEFYDGALIDPASGIAASARNRRDPAETITSHRPASGDDLAPDPLTAYRAEEQVFRIGPGGIPVPVEE